MEKKDNNQTSRTPLSKKIRFEVFKRDSFKCQYCGQQAPDVLLEIDHIKPVSQGGDNDILNLTTSCYECNRGKGARKLGDNAVIKKRHSQLDQLQKRKEQIDMMLEWHEGLTKLGENTVEKLCDYWTKKTTGVVTDRGKNHFEKLLKRYSLDEILTAIDTAVVEYIRFDENDEVIVTALYEAFSKITAFCNINRDSKDDPDIRELYYIRGIARKRCPNYFKDGEALKLLKHANNCGVPKSELKSIARQCYSWTNFRESIEELMFDTESEDE